MVMAPSSSCCLQRSLESVRCHNHSVKKQSFLTESLSTKLSKISVSSAVWQAREFIACELGGQGVIQKFLNRVLTAELTTILRFRCGSFRHLRGNVL
jgi:hypothetical protein